MKMLRLVAVATASASQPAAAQTFPSSAGNLNVETIASGLTNPWGLAFLPDGRDARHRAAGTAAHRDARRQAVAAGRGRAAGARIGPGRIARRRARPRLRLQQDDLFLLRRARLRRRTHRDGARQAHRRRSAEARRRQGDLPPGGSALERQPLRLPHRAGARRQSLAHDGRSLQPARRGAEPRQSHRQDRARDAGRRSAAGQSVRQTQGRQAGNLELRPSQLPRRRAASRRPASCGSTSTARAAATRSTFRSPERITAGR